MHLPLQSKAKVAAALLDRIEKLLTASVRLKPDATHDNVDRDQLAEHLRFAAELGVAGVSRDPAWRDKGTRTIIPRQPDGRVLTGARRSALSFSASPPRRSPA